MPRLKSVHVPRGYHGLHCEVDGCIVNIYPGLTDHNGRSITTIVVNPDRYVGESWSVIEHSDSGIRVRRDQEEK